VKIILIISTLLFSAGIMADSNLCENHEVYFNKNFKIAYVSEAEVMVTGLSPPSQFEEILVPVNGVFFGPLDKHSKIEYKVASISKENIKVSYSSSFNASSFGGEITTCAGVLNVK